MDLYSDDYLRGRTIAELHEMKHSSEQIMRERRRERDKLHWSNPDREEHNEVIDNNSRAIGMIHRELDRQHAERNAARELKEASRSARTTAETVLDAWFKLHKKTPPYRINLNWFVDDRQYMGSYRPKQGDLEVFLVVAPNTPGCERRAGKALLPANSPEELAAALQADPPQSREEKRRS
ncbi:hypothetical protein QF038_001847 [Pseudarthrobacter sp. W1I19]|uniref:hypothetical protein n=1 Tax=Pseudarthrobacter sp. W1I19 TaxID=3042288 RepID=UPI00277FA4F6|nr:hypothetical protein [Pseudarthrobacter sp. W1I19]MDQ0923339.1 hypothetical protein [Pseudarthrobacter sp. W1I19]